ncbi:MAG: hypothetical protein M0Z81_14915 [Deltaproteobacteria bacterium]|jgi:hypothetical protein|nr:hypothetical protein [Deltaproteobacteria bacterium]
MLVGLKRASQLVGKDRSTLHRAMVKGKLSYSTSESGERLIDTSELHRVYGIQGAAVEPCNDAPATHSNDAQLTELRAQLETERVKVALLTDQLQDVRDDRERWRSMAEQSNRLLTDLREKKPTRGFWKRLFRR